jgi:thiamine biosynthesis protein ThiI
VGQVASQTLEGLGVTNSAVNLPVLRPLVGMDKIEITQKAEMYGTFKTSILPYEDCCTVFVPKHPVIRPKMSEIEKAEAALDVDAMIDRAVKDVHTMIIDG